MTTPAGGGAGRGAARKVDDDGAIPVGAHHGGSFGVYMRHKVGVLNRPVDRPLPAAIPSVHTPIHTPIPTTRADGAAPPAVPRCGRGRRAEPAVRGDGVPRQRAHGCAHRGAAPANRPPRRAHRAVPVLPVRTYVRPPECLSPNPSASHHHQVDRPITVRNLSTSQGHPHPVQAPAARQDPAADGPEAGARGAPAGAHHPAALRAGLPGGG